MTPDTPRNLPIRSFLLAATAWTMLQAWYLVQYGLITHQEALHYKDLAHNLLLRDRSLAPHDYFYFGYVVIRAAQFAAGLPDFFVYLVQSAAALAAIYALLRWLHRLGFTGSKLLFGGLLFAICPITQFWNIFLYTDSLFLSLLVAALSLLLAPPHSRAGRITFWCIIVLLPFFRPQGYLFVISALLWWLLQDPVRHQKKLAVVLVYCLCLTGFTVYTLKQSEGFFYPWHNAGYNIICGLPSHLSAQLKQPYIPGQPIWKFLLQEPWLTVQLFAWRLFKALWLTRPHFSFMHNAWLAMVCLFYYGLSLMGLIRLHGLNRTLFRFLLLVPAIWLMPSMVFCADWSNRIVVPAFLFFIMMATQALAPKNWRAEGTR